MGASDEEITWLKIFFSRLAHTNPSKLFIVENSKTQADLHIARIWYAANTCLGSWHVKLGKEAKKQKAKGDIRAHFDTNTKDPTTDSNINKAPPQGSNKKTKSKSNPPNKADDTIITADQTANNVKNFARIQLAVKISLNDKTSAADYLFTILTEMLEKLQSTDASTIILPWNTKHMTKYKAVTNPDAFPSTLTEFKPYTEGCRPKNNSTIWFKMYFGCNDKTDNLTHSDNSDNHDWFDDNEIKAYFTAVQESSDTISICNFTYTGAFNDHNRFEQVIRDVLSKIHKGPPLKFGCRIRRNNEIKLDDNRFRDWTMAPNQMINLEAD
jgi:hypothetical protein